METRPDYDPNSTENIVDRHEAGIVNRMLDGGHISRSGASTYSYERHSEANVETSEENYSTEARQLMRDLLNETRADPSPTFEKYKEKAINCLRRIQEISIERDGEDHTIWLNFQMALAYDHFAANIEEFHHYYLKKLDSLEELVNNFPDKEIAVYWFYKLKEYFPDQFLDLEQQQQQGQN